MGRSPCCDEEGVKKGPWTPEEDKNLVDYIQKNGHGSWRALPKRAGLNRCGKSCRLRWTNYLRPDIKRGKFCEEEERLILHLHSILGNKWSAMATRLPGRTDNEIKNYWNTHLKKKLLHAGIDPVTHRPRADLSLLANLSSFLPAVTNLGSGSTWDGGLRVPAAAADAAAQLARFQLLQSVVRAIVANTPSNTDLVGLLGSALLRRSSPVGDLLRPGQQFPAGVLGRGMDDSTLQSGLAAIPQIPCDDLHLPGQPSASPSGGGFTSLADVSSSKASTVNNSGCAARDHRMSNSYNNVLTGASTPSLASASPEHLAVDQFQDIIYAGDDWSDLSEPDVDYYWKEMLDLTTLQS